MSHFTMGRKQDSRAIIGVILACLPIVLLGWLLLKSAEDNLIAEQARRAQQEQELLTLHGQLIEKQITEVITHWQQLASAPNALQQLRADPRVRGIRRLAGGAVQPDSALRARSAEVSQWLLSPTDHNSERLHEWLGSARFSYQPSFILFVLQESQLSSAFPGLEETLHWELSASDPRGVPLSDSLSVLWNHEALPALPAQFYWDSSEAAHPVKGIGERIGLRREQAATPRQLRPLILLGIFLWILLLIGLLLRYAHAQKKEAQESLDRLSTVSHEFRTPLTGMKLLLEQLQQQHPSETLTRIEAERQRLESIIEQFLVQGKLTNDALQLQQTDWQQWLLAEAQRYEHLQIAPVPLQLRSLPPHHTTLYLDPGLMNVALTNLLKNAAQYGDGTQITLEEVRTEQSLGLAVINHGAPIAPGLLHRMFHKYERGEMALSRHTEGLGLGLSIVHDIVTLHQGRITITSDTVTRIELTLPLDP